MRHRFSARSWAILACAVTERTGFMQIIAPTNATNIMPLVIELNQSQLAG